MQYQRFIILFLAVFILLAENSAQKNGIVKIVGQAEQVGDIYFYKKDIKNIAFKKGKEPLVKYSSNEVEYYITKKAKVVSIKVQGNSNETAFVEELVTGTYSLYRSLDKKPFYVISDGEYHHLSHDNYKNTLIEIYTACENSSKLFSRAKYSKNSLVGITHAMNRNNCLRMPSTEISGVLSGGVIRTIVYGRSHRNGYIEFDDFRYNDAAISFGVYVVEPIWKSKKLSVTLGAQYMRQDLEGIIKRENEQLNYVIKLNNIFFSPGVQYTIKENKRFALNLLSGADFTINLKPRSRIYRHTFKESVAYLGGYASLEMNSVTPGIYLGLGANVYYSQENYVGIELKSSHYRFSYNIKGIDFSSLMLSIKMNI